MTTPGGVTNLPAAALTLETMQSKLQDQTSTAHRARAAARIPSIFDAGTGGNPLSNLSPMGIIAGLFAGFQHIVANADPADITSPEDLPGLLTDFIESLPVIGQLVGLAEAILGTYDGDDPILLQIQDLFAPIRQFLHLLAGGITAGFPTPLDVQLGFKRLQSIFSPVHVSRVTDAPINLVDDPNFELEDSISPVDGWSRDTSKSATGVGASAKVVCDGSLKRLFHRTIIEDVTAGHTYNFSAQIETDSFVTTDVTEITLSIVEYHGDAMGEIKDVAVRTTGSATFVVMSGNYTVPAGVTSIGLCFGNVGATGSLWFSALDLHETDKMPPSYVLGLTDFMTALNQFGDIVNGLVVTPINGAVANFNDWWHDITEQANDTGDKVRDGFKALFDNWFGGTSATGTPAEVAATIASIKTVIGGGWTLEVLTTSGNWTVPADPILEFHPGVFGSGSGGQGGSGGAGGLGGQPGAYVMTEVNPALLGAAGTLIPYVVGVGGAGGVAGAAAPANGADSSFGTFVTSAGFTGGSVSTMFGYSDAFSASQPGAGGDGGIGGGSAANGTDGGATPLAAGGAHGVVGTGHNGSSGGNADLSGTGRAGGGGGGGAAGGNLTPGATGFGGNGGNGGFPGGGGGGGGGQGFGGTPGDGGNGGHGCVVLIYRQGA